jgi:ABC-type branched-subunit amino acid transport system ATPase component
MTQLLNAEAISVNYGGVAAVREVSIAVAAGEALGLVGPNGSGKTTLLNALCGLVAASGELRVGDARVPLSRPGAGTATGVARVFEVLTVLENVMVADRRRTATGLWAAWGRRRRLIALERQRVEQARQALETVGLGVDQDELAYRLTYGQRRLLDLARAIAAQPQVLLLDEPSAGLNEVETEHLSQLLLSWKSQGVSIVLVDHKIGFIEAVCDRVAVLNEGALVATGTADEVWASPIVQTAFLGTV